MLILGVTNDDKGAQLEALVARILEGESYLDIRLNRVDAGGNELDVTAVRETTTLGKTQRTHLIGEAKAYRDTVGMPEWQKFLGKLHLARLDDPATAGVLVALNGVNGNVAGSLKRVSQQDTRVSVTEGADLERQLIASKRLVPKDSARALAARHFNREPESLEPAFYSGSFFWVVRWPLAEYAVISGLGEALSSEHVESLRPALENVLEGTLLLPDSAQQRAEAAHHARLQLMNELFGDGVPAQSRPLTKGKQDEVQAVVAATNEPFTAVLDGNLTLRPPLDLDADAVCRLFQFIVSGPIGLRYLDFAERGLHRPYVDRLIDMMPSVQAGFKLSDEDLVKVKAIAPLFPSLWALLSQPIGMITTHRVAQPDLPVNESVAASERNSFWEAVTESMWSDFVNPWLSGFLYDRLNVAEIERRTMWIVKTKTERLADVTVEMRAAIKQLSEEWVGPSGTRHTLVSMMQHADEPWDEDHPPPLPLPAQKSHRRRTAKKTAAKRPAKKTAAKRPAKKTAAKQSAKKTAAKQSAKKTAAKQSAKKTAAKQTPKDGA